MRDMLRELPLTCPEDSGEERMQPAHCGRRPCGLRVKAKQEVKATLKVGKRTWPKGQVSSVLTGTLASATTKQH